MKHLKYYALGCGSLLLYPFLQLILRVRHPQVYRFYNLESFIGKAYMRGNYDIAEALALEYLDLAGRFQDDWNYGNAIHTSHQILGLIRLREGKLKEAKEHLLAAGRTPGSPQLDSYGPRMALARELLLKGQKEVVTQYLDLVAKFWASEENVPSGDMEKESKALASENKALIKQWKAEVKKGQLPQHKRWS